ncbi:Mediator complex subunit Med10 [Penicillium coprophilum]|uniref:Mediator complex subunit Med10 n=1 Tax=Penicillium coprophilum TaxID=36646 RepID=UPI002391200A|nr:Mediator complex subunit Med10 [Penicillium coprophilum]KAJ5162997.1 Mediator complex subunit Med10 [Penicillium coprophilum]
MLWLTSSNGHAQVKQISERDFPDLKHNANPKEPIGSSMCPLSAEKEKENEVLRQKCAQLRGSNTITAGRVQSELENSVASASSPCTSLSSSRVAGIGLSRNDFSSTSTRDASHPEVPENNRRNTSLYHGPTSTVYDDTTPDHNEQNRHGQSNEEGTRHFLFSQTARQRQLEPLNLAAGKLDFDGTDPGIGMHLLCIYWSRQLYTAQIIYRPAFMRDMACEGPYFSKLLLNAIFFVVSKHCDRPELRSDPNDITTAGWKFRQRFTQLLRDCFDKSEITTLQALLIMSNALFSRCDERSLSWLYAGNAFNMFIDLGLHVLPDVDSIPAEELEIRKRVLWGAYLIDKIQCLFQGRPPLLNRVNLRASLNFLDDYDELEPFQAITYTTTKPRAVVPSLNVSLLTNLCGLTTIVERILREIYSESRESNLAHRANISEEIKSQLRIWRQNLPLRLDYLSFPEQAVLLPQSACLLALFNVLIILVHRPLIIGHDGVINSTTAHESVNACTSAANQIVQILHDYSQHFSLSSAPYMLSYATYISATIHARIVAQKGSNSTVFQSLILCRNILSEHTRLYSAAEKAKENLDKLISHLGISTADDDQRTGSPGGPGSTGNTVPSEHIVIDESINVAGGGVADCALEFGSSIMNLELSDLDLDAIAQGFQVDVESHSFWNSLV